MPNTVRRPDDDRRRWEAQRRRQREEAERREQARTSRDRRQRTTQLERQSLMGPMDLPFLLLTLLLTGVGLVMVFSASFPSAYYETGDGAYYFKRQLIFAVLGLFAMVVMSRINYQRLRGASKLLLGFLYYNHYPAKVFMGDTGSLFLGGAIAALAFAYDMPLILLLVGFVYLCETLSDIIQVAYFKATHGKRIFKMAPLHHHFEMCGWNEKKIVAVFTAVSALMCLLAYWGVADRFSL